MKTFEPNKTITQLGIDITREFVVVERNNQFNKWDILIIERDDRTKYPYFKRVSDWKSAYTNLNNLNYAEESFEMHEQIAVSDDSIEEAIEDLAVDIYKFYYTWGKTRDWSHIVEDSNGAFDECKYIAKIPKEIVIKTESWETISITKDKAKELWFNL